MEAPAQFLLIILALEKTQETVQPNILFYIWEKPETLKGEVSVPSPHRANDLTSASAS